MAAAAGLLSVELEDDDELEADSFLPSDFVSDLDSDLPSEDSDLPSDFPESDFPSDFEESALDEAELDLRLSVT
ncbi:MAG TPA: hypothetical protein VMW62_02930 [Chloroflexota bacterium]|nr:hypothetical protein [Chloroflexota bacterium]